jgi:hypothetical protein
LHTRLTSPMTVSLSLPDWITLIILIKLTAHKAHYVIIFSSLLLSSSVPDIFITLLSKTLGQFWKHSQWTVYYVLYLSDIQPFSFLYPQTYFLFNFVPPKLLVHNFKLHIVCNLHIK